MGISVKEGSCEPLNPYKLEKSRDAGVGAMFVEDTTKSDAGPGQFGLRFPSKSSSLYEYYGLDEPNHHETCLVGCRWTPLT